MHQLRDGRVYGLAGQPECHLVLLGLPGWLEQQLRMPKPRMANKEQPVARRSCRMRKPTRPRNELKPRRQRWQGQSEAAPWLNRGPMCGCRLCFQWADTEWRNQNPCVLGISSCEAAVTLAYNGPFYQLISIACKAGTCIEVLAWTSKLLSSDACL